MNDCCSEIGGYGQRCSGSGSGGGRGSALHYGSGAACCVYKKLNLKINDLEEEFFFSGVDGVRVAQLRMPNLLRTLKGSTKSVRVHQGFPGHSKRRSTRGRSKKRHEGTRGRSQKTAMLVPLRGSGRQTTLLHWQPKLMSMMFLRWLRPASTVACHASRCCPLLA